VRLEHLRQRVDHVLRHLLAHLAVAVEDARKHAVGIAAKRVDGDGAVLVDLGGGTARDGL